MAIETQRDGTLLAEFAASGSQEHYEELIRRHSRMVFNVCHRLLGDTHDAEDAAQAVFLTLCRKARSLTSRSSVAPWLHHVARNVSMNASRARALRKTREREAVAMAQQQRDDHEQWDRIKDLLDGELDSLARKYRLPIILFHLENRSIKEIAAMLGAKTSTVETRLSRGRKQLKDRLARRGIAVSAVILTGILTEQTSLANVPAALTTTTVKAATLIATGQTATGGLISAQAAALTQGALTMLTVAKIKVAAAIVAATLVVTGSGVGVYHAVAKPATGASKPVSKANKTPAAAPSKVQLAPANCVACEIGMTAEKVFARLDANGNKKVTVKEFSRSPGIRSEAEARAAVGRIDTDGDGTLSWVELSKAYKIRHANCPKPTTRPAGGRSNRNLFVKVFIMQNDKNGDGAVDKSEFRGSGDRFDKMDKNSNGKLDDDELAELHNRRMQDPKSMDERLKSGDLPHRPPWMTKDGAKKATSQPTTRPDGRGDRNRFVKIFMMQSDKNGDGVIDKSEFRGSDARFDQMDKNSNGKLEAGELADLHNRRMQDPKSMHQRRKSGDTSRRPTSRPEPNTNQ